MQAVDTARMRAFWDERAREDPFHASDERQPFRRPDLARFWRDGERDLAALLETLELELPPGGRVVDVGCGVGRLTRALARRAAHVTAVDVSQEMLARARELHDGLENVEWVLGDGLGLAGIEDGSQDAVICCGMLAHVPDPRVQLGYVAEFGRVLRPGGWAAFDLSTDPGAHEPQAPPQPAVHSRRGFLKALVGRAPAGREEPEWLGAFVPLDALGATALQAGLDLERIEGANTAATLVRAVRTAA
jgi:ubiquinone/menaquinone biosynthesis C-methylase UbiE